MNFKNIKLFAVDLDGTIWLGNTIIPGAVELINYLQKKYQVVFHTNASVKTKEEVREKLNSFGIDCKLNEIYTSASITIDYLKKNNIDNFFIIGSENFCKNIIDNDFIINYTDKAEHVVVGMDDNFCYSHIKKALSILLRGGKFIACNADANFPVDTNNFLPGCGAVVGAIEGASKIKSYIVGKPNIYMLEKITQDFNIIKEEIIVVGDSFDSDIIMAINFGCKSILISSNTEHYFQRSEFLTLKNIEEFFYFIKLRRNAI